jgi:integrase
LAFVEQFLSHFGNIFSYLADAEDYYETGGTPMGVSILRRKLTHGRIGLYLDITHNGKRWKESLRLILQPGDRVGNKEKLLIAKRKCADKDRELANSRFGYVPEVNWNRNFLSYFENLKTTKNEVGHNWHSTAVHLRTFAGDNIPFREIDEEWLEDFKDFLLENFKRNSAHTYFSKVKAALRQAVKERIIPSNPAEHVDQIPREEVPRVHLSLDEVQLLADTPSPDPELKRAFLFSCFSGLRISDVRALRWKNVRGSKLEYQQRKTGKYEYLPLTMTAIELLGPPGKKDDLVFTVPADQRVSVLMRRWCQTAGIDKAVTYHSSRHTYATLSLTNGTDLATIQSLLGHRSIRTTQIYAQIVDSKKQDAADRFPKIKL